MKKDEREQKLFDLERMYNDSISSSENLNTSSLLSNIDFSIDKTQDPDYIDYEKILDEAIIESSEVVDNMAELYLDGNTELVNNPYLAKKRKHDAVNLADMLFLQKMAKRAVIKQLKQMDEGSMGARDFETFYGGLKEIRENIKQSTSTQNIMEGFYKSIREDLSHTKLGEESGIGNDNDTKNEKLNIQDPKNMNSRLDDLIKGIKDKKGDDKKKG